MAIIDSTAALAGAPAPSPRLELREEQMRKVAGQFEEIFLRQMLSQMSPKGAESEGAGKVYQEMYQEQVAKLGAGSERGGIGIARLLMRQWGLE